MFRAGRIIESNSRMAAGDIKQTGAELGQAIDQHLTQEDVLGYGAASNARTLQLHNEIDQLKDPSDPQQVAQVTQKYNDDISALQEQYGRTEASRFHVGEVGQQQTTHAYEYAHGVMAQAAGVKAVNAYMEQGNTGAAIVEKDASALPQQMQQLNATYDTISGGLGAAGKTELARHKDQAMQHLVTTWGRGLINNNPEAAQKILEGADPNITKFFPDFGTEVKMAIDRKKSMDALGAANARAARVDNAARAENSLWFDMNKVQNWDPQTAAQFTARANQIGTMSGVRPGFGADFGNWLKADKFNLETGGGLSNNAQTVSTLDSAVQNGSLTPDQVAREYGMHHLDKDTYTFYNEVARGMVGGSDVAGSTGAVVNTINQYSNAVGNQFRALNNPGLAAQEEAQVQSELRKQWLNGQQNGISNQEMLTDQKSKYYLGNVLQNHLYTQKDIVARSTAFQLGRPMPGAEPRPEVPQMEPGMAKDPSKFNSFLNKPAAGAIAAQHQKLEAPPLLGVSP
jgi:hypothetical protein